MLHNVQEGQQITDISATVQKSERLLVREDDNAVRYKKSYIYFSGMCATLNRPFALFVCVIDTRMESKFISSGRQCGFCLHE